MEKGSGYNLQEKEALTFRLRSLPSLIMLFSFHLPVLHIYKCSFVKLQHKPGNCSEPLKATIPPVKMPPVVTFPTTVQL